MKAQMDGAARRLAREYNDRAWLAWHIEALARAKKLPQLKDLLVRPTPRAKTPEQLESILRDWMARLAAGRPH